MNNLEIKTKRKNFKFKNSLKITYKYSPFLLKKFSILKKKIITRKEKEKDYQCIFEDCEKTFPNYTRWMLHYRVHVNNK